jgi:hypothetical protein
MKPLRITLFIIAFVILASQTFRHAYVRWIETRTSVLDKYNTETEKQISAAKSLDELVRQYDAAHAEVEKEKAAKTKNPDAAEQERQRQEVETEAEKKARSLRDRGVGEQEQGRP